MPFKQQKTTGSQPGGVNQQCLAWIQAHNCPLGIQCPDEQKHSRADGRWREAKTLDLDEFDDDEDYPLPNFTLMKTKHTDPYNVLVGKGFLLLANVTPRGNPDIQELLQVGLVSRSKSDPSATKVCILTCSGPVEFKEDGIGEWYVKVRGKVEFRKMFNNGAHGDNKTQESRTEEAERSFTFRFTYAGRIQDSGNSWMAVLSGLKKIWRNEEESSPVREQPCWVGLKADASCLDLPSCGVERIAQPKLR
ncbi:hypothetical protein LTS18_005778 [Coniosporium uncinatum]|uniref:Uncharacterized protein n=1 Tax=Coniosporium uncinatum TaxID=93489 RepID=A0ACC3D4K2_9PEZI|nr:hypothetical protein LTS18_005778 [Coniosporium uncinatum]